MSGEDFMILASRTLAVLMMVWALTEVSYLPGTVHSFLLFKRTTRFLFDDRVLSTF
jgi:hypothetical protein